MEIFNMIINGQSVTADAKMDVINPSTGKAFAQCQKANAADVDKAVSAARAAFKSWSETPVAIRKEKILAIAGAMEKNMPALMELITKETGKPMAGLNQIGSGMEVGGSMAWAQFTTSLSMDPEVLQDDDNHRIELHRKSLGVVASILPWNWPLMISIWHSMPAILAGNTIVMKPSPVTPLATIRLAELAQEILPPGVLNVVTGGNDVGIALTQHKDIDKITFTGSAATGKEIMKTASANLVRLTLELGGNDAGIVLPDVNVQAVAPSIFTALFHNNGQTCACMKRLYVHESIHDALCDALVAEAKKITVGDGMGEVDLGPIQNKMQYEKVVSFAKQAKADGGSFIAGGNAIPGDGYFFEPTLVAGLKDGTQLVDEEQFGPIAPIIAYSDLDVVIEQANKNPSGLGGSVWSSDLAKAAEVAAKMECGTVWINEHGSIQPNMPFGGVKQSGFGLEFGQHGLDEFVWMQSVKTPKKAAS